MREELRRESDMRSAGLTTADLAGVDERETVSKKDLVRDNRDKGLDKGTAELESRQIEFQTDNDESELDEPRVERSAIASGPVPAVAPVAVEAADESRTAPLFSPAEADEFHERWNAVQVGFVDEPRQAVQDADGLVAGAMKRLAEIFAEERARLDQQWDRGGDVSTEDLRIALRRYRSFFGRLLSV